MKRSKYIVTGFLATSLFSVMLMANKPVDTNVDSSANKEVSRLEALTKFTQVISLVEKYYVEDIELNKLIDKSLEGLLTNLDAHSNFLDKKYFEELKIQTNGEFGGLGITVGMRDGALTVISPIEGTPADRAGIKASDIILKINDKSAINMTLNEAVGIMRGKPNTKITLTIVRKKEPKPIEIEIVRDIIKIDSVYSKFIEDDVLYLRVTNFDKKVVNEVKDAISKNRDRKGIILDLRNNPGGLLDQAVGLVDLFVDNGIIVSQKGRDSKEDTLYKASKSDTISNAPLVVLINEGSASASEIVSGALQDHKRAIIVGKKSFGKGSVQVILPISKKEGIKLTVARYYLPSDRTIQAVGVTPDIIVEAGEVVVSDENDYKIKEADLKKHLESELAKVNPESKKDEKEQKIDENKDTKDIISTEDINKDIQLKSAIDILKALIITNNRD
jgi:carboxyl-terminal processing protease